MLFFFSETCYPPTAPPFIARCFQAWSHALLVGRCRTIRRADGVTHAAIFSNLSRSVVTCDQAPSAPASSLRISCISTNEAAVISTRSWFGRNFMQLVRSISRP